MPQMRCLLVAGMSMLTVGVGRAVTPSPLVGRWDAETRSRGGIGTWIELAGAGSCSQTTGAMVDGSWKLDGNQFTVLIPLGAGAPAVQRVTSTIEGDTQTQVVEGQTRRLTRRGPAPTQPPAIVGIWTYPHPAGGNAYEEYKPDGRLLFRLPMTSTLCRWTVDADRLVITTRTESRKMRWQIVGDRLTIEGDGQPRSFRRERADVIPPAVDTGR